MAQVLREKTTSIIAGTTLLPQRCQFGKTPEWTDRSPQLPTTGIPPAFRTASSNPTCRSQQATAGKTEQRIKGCTVAERQSLVTGTFPSPSRRCLLNWCWYQGLSITGPARDLKPILSQTSFIWTSENLFFLPHKAWFLLIWMKGLTAVWKLSALGPREALCIPSLSWNECSSLLQLLHCIWINLTWPTDCQLFWAHLAMQRKHSSIPGSCTFGNWLKPLTSPNLLDSPLGFCALDRAKYSVPGCAKLQRVLSRGNYRIPYSLALFKEKFSLRSPHWTVSSHLHAWQSNEEFVSRNRFLSIFSLKKASWV